MKLQAVPNCLVCGKAGRTLYTGLHDTHTSVEGEWSFSTCDSCELTWLDPRPAVDDINALYGAHDKYYTHDTEINDWDLKLIAGRERECSFSERVQLALFAKYAGKHDWRPDALSSRVLAGLMWMFPHVRDVIGGRVGWLRHQPGATLLDVGCGGGAFLALMRHLGWNVSGLEPDLEACRAAWTRFKLPIHHGDLDTAPLPPESFDVVTSFHAIEHMERPFDLIEGGLRLLKPGGIMVIVTPNGRGLGHRFFRASFSDLLPPRHLHLFSGQLLTQKAKQLGARVVRCRSTARRGHTVWVDSWNIRRTGHLTENTSHLQKLLGVPFQLLEECARVFYPMAGDEIVLVISKPHSHHSRS